MAKVDTNTIGLRWADESTYGEAPTSGYVAAEPNEIGNFGAAVTTTPRAPISINRQRRKGAVTDLEAGAGYTEDLTFSAFRSWIEAAMFAKSENVQATDIPVSDVSGGNDEYEVAAITDEQDEVLIFINSTDGGSLIWADGFANAANNGLKSLDTDAASGDTEIGVNESLVNESNADGYVSLAGFRIFAAESKAWTWSDSNKTLTLDTSAGTLNIGTVLNGNGLTAGQLVHIGSVPSKGGALQNGMTATGGPYYGYARVKSFTADTIVFDKVASALQRTVGANTSDVLDLVFGEFIRNVAVNVDSFLERSRTLELESPGLGDIVTQVSGAQTLDTASHTLNVDSNADIESGDHLEIGGEHRVTVTAKSGTGGLTVRRAGSSSVAIADDADVRLIDDFEYAVGMLTNTLTVNMPLTDKATMALAMIGSDVQTPDQQKGRSGTAAASAARSGDAMPRKVTPFNTAADFARLRITDVDDDGLTSDFKSLSITINNNLTGEKVLGVLGNKFVNTGILFVDLAAQLIFSSPEVPRAIRENTTLRADAIIANEDGVIGFDIPSLTIGGGDREYPTNQAVLVNATVQAFADEDLDTSIGISILPCPIPS